MSHQFIGPVRTAQLLADTSPGRPDHVTGWPRERNAIHPQEISPRNDDRL
jgi:hypothetical protein